MLKATKSWEKFDIKRTSLNAWRDMDEKQRELAYKRDIYDLKSGTVRTMTDLLNRDRSKKCWFWIDTYKDDYSGCPDEKEIKNSPIANRIAELEELGFKRWQKGKLDRLYINPEFLGLHVELYGTGNVRYAELDGEKISNREATGLKNCKTYIDVATGEVYSDWDHFAEAAKKLAKLE